MNNPVDINLSRLTVPRTLALVAKIERVLSQKLAYEVDWDQWRCEIHDEKKG